MRISKRFSPFAGVTRKRGRVQFAGISAPGLAPAESCGSATQRVPENVVLAGPKSVAAFDGGVPSMIGAEGKSVQLALPEHALGGTVMCGAPPPAVQPITAAARTTAAAST